MKKIDENTPKNELDWKKRKRMSLNEIVVNKEIIKIAKHEEVIKQYESDIEILKSHVEVA